MIKQPSRQFNEPLIRARGDAIPKLAQVTPRSLTAVLRARIELEAALRVCGVGSGRKRFKFTAIHRQILLAMLSETDSPLSASLRARATGIVGKLKINEAAPILRKIALDEGDDLQTRLGAVSSYLTIRGDAAVRDVRKLFDSPEILVRAVAYVTALQSKEEKLVAVAETQFRTEKSSQVRAIVVRRVPRLQSADMTEEDAPPSRPEKAK